MSTVSVIVRIQLSAESALAYAEAAKAVVAATREEAGCQCCSSKCAHTPHTAYICFSLRRGAGLVA